MICQQCKKDKGDDVTEALLPLTLFSPFKHIYLCLECFDKIWEEGEEYKGD